MALKPKFSLKTDELTSEQTLEVTPAETATTLTRYMIGSFHKDGVWFLTTAKFDPSTGAMGEYKEQRVGQEWALLREAHNLAIAKLNIYEPEVLQENN